MKMKTSFTVRVLSAIYLVLSLVASAQANFDLQVTEIWPGNSVGTDVTDDWFEVTNFGTSAWTAATDGPLYFDDSNPVEEDPNTGLDVLASSPDLIFDPLDVADPPTMPFATIAAGESVIFVDGSVTDFFNAWSAVIPVADFPRLGSYNGSGLSGSNGDAVSLFLDSASDGVDVADLLSETPYPAGAMGRSYDANVGGFSNAGFGGLLTLAPNDEGVVTVASPGFLPSVVPEPNAMIILLLGAGMAASLLRRRG